MVKQSDWIAEQEEALQQLKLELESAEKEFAQFSEITKKLQAIAKEQSHLSDQEYRRKVDLARLVSSDPEKYASGHSHQVKPEIVAKAMKKLGVSTYQENDTYRAIVDTLWRQYCDIRKNDSEVVRLNSEYQRLSEEYAKAKHPFVKKYDELDMETHHLRNVIKSRECYIEENKDITVFRQTAKDLKARQERLDRQNKDKQLKERVSKWLASNVWAKVQG